jgi:hypothetical protein
MHDREVRDGSSASILAFKKSTLEIASAGYYMQTIARARFKCQGLIRGMAIAPAPAFWARITAFP